MTVLDSFMSGKCCLYIGKASDSDLAELSKIIQDKYDIEIRDGSHTFPSFFHFCQHCKTCDWNYVFYDKQLCIFGANIHVSDTIGNVYSIEFCLQDYEKSNTMKPGDKITLLENFHKKSLPYEPFIVDSMIHKAGNTFTYDRDCTHHEGWIYLKECKFVWDKRWFRVEKDFDVTQEEILKFLDEVLKGS